MPPSPFNDEAYYVFEQAFLIVVSLSIGILLICQLLFEREYRSRNVPETKIWSHRVLLLTVCLLGVRSIDPRGRYDILPQPLLGFVVINVVPTLASCAGKLLVSALNVIARTTRQPLPAFFNRAVLAGPVLAIAVPNGLTIARFAVPAEWLEGAAYFALCMPLFMSLFVVQIILYRTRQVIIQHLANVVHVRTKAGDQPTANLLEKQARSLHHNRMQHLICLPILLALFLSLAIVTVQRDLPEASPETYETVPHYIFIYFSVVILLVFVWITWLPRAPAHARYNAAAVGPSDLHGHDGTKSDRGTNDNETRDTNNEPTGTK